MGSKLTDVAIRKAVPNPDKIIRLHDEKGLYLEISPAGLRTWRVHVRAKGNEKRHSIGHYPAMSLVAARKQRDLIRNPEAAPAPEVPPAPLREVAAEWHATNKARWNADHAMAVLSSLEKEVFPTLGDMCVRTITPLKVKELLKSIEARGVHDRAHDIRQRLEAVFRYAKASGLCETNPAADMRDVLQAIPPAKPRAAVVTIDAARACLAAGEAVPAFPATRIALRFLAITAQRPGEVRKAEWSEFEGLEPVIPFPWNPIWRIPAEHMKMGREHIVPLAPAAVELLAVLRDLTGNAEICFPAFHDSMKPISENAMGYLLNRAGYAGRHVPHGWRAAFSTIMNGRRPADRAVIDLMLSHEKEDKIEAAYNRQTHWDTRVDIAAEWALLLLKGAKPAEELLDGPKRSPRAPMALIGAPA
jgi:integrase